MFFLPQKSFRTNFSILVPSFGLLKRFLKSSALDVPIVPYASESRPHPASPGDDGDFPACPEAAEDQVGGGGALMKFFLLYFHRKFNLVV